MGQCLATPNESTNNEFILDRESSRRGGRFMKASWFARYRNKRLLHRRGGVPHNSQMDVYEIVQQGKKNKSTGQHHLLYNKRNTSHKKRDSPHPEKQQHPETYPDDVDQNSSAPTRLLQRTDLEDGSNHIYAIRCRSELLQLMDKKDPPQSKTDEPEQRPVPRTPPSSSLVVPTTPSTVASTSTAATPVTTTTTATRVDSSANETNKNDLYTPESMAAHTSKPIIDWVCVSAQNNVYVCDTGLTERQCDEIVQETEQACRGHYAAYTYAKQTLGCRDHSKLAQVCFDVVHSVCSAIHAKFPPAQGTNLVLDDREPHMVKYDVTKRERQKLDMHTDKSEWTFLIALSDGCGLDYDGGGTYFEALDSTVHVQRGHALVFPGKLRHCGRKISKGLRFLLVGFLVDKSNQSSTTTTTTTTTACQQTVTTTTVIVSPPTTTTKAKK